jgi:hypothetical protein
LRRESVHELAVAAEAAAREQHAACAAQPRFAPLALGEHHLDPGTVRRAQ